MSVAQRQDKFRVGDVVKFVHLDCNRSVVYDGYRSYKMIYDDAYGIIVETDCWDYKVYFFKERNTFRASEHQLELIARGHYEGKAHED